MTAEAQLVLQYIQHTNRNIFLTGKAGTGKTTLLKKILKTTYKNAVIVAPTGIAALNAGGVTIHSFFQLPFSSFIPTDDFKNEDEHLYFENKSSIKRHFKMNKTKQTLLKNLELLVIDEVSMLRADLLDAMNEMLQYVRRSQEPFGGVQVLFIGDLWQLPPVVKSNEWKVLKKYYNGIYFFNAWAMRYAEPLYIELKKIYRQDDARFVQLLNNFRNNCVTEQDDEILKGCVQEDFDTTKNKGYITLTTHNKKADEINEKELSSIKSQEFVFLPEIVGDFPSKIYPLEAELVLKKGAQVMFVKNDLNFEKRYYNGKIGFVSYISADEIEVFLPEEGIKIQVEKYEWQNVRYTINPKTKEIDEEVLGTFVQYPLKLAWAITVHKSQGLTFDKAVLDINDVFMSGQAYVALSRLRSLDGLVLSKPVAIRQIQTDHSIIQYLDRNQLSENEVELMQAKKEFIWKQIRETFDWTQAHKQFLTWIQSWIDDKKSPRSIYFTWAAKQEKLLEHISFVGVNFLKELHQLFVAPEFNKQLLIERLEKAYDYFYPKLEELAYDTLFVLAQSKTKKGFVLFTEQLMTFENDHIRMILKLMKTNKMMLLFKDNTTFTKQNLECNEISDYRHNHLENIKSILKSEELEIDIDEKKTTKKEKRTQISTIDKTFELWKKNKSIAQIAEERKLTIATISQHISKLVGQRRIEIKTVLPDDKIATLTELFQNFEEETLTEIKAKAPSHISWEDLRIFKSYLDNVI